MVRAVDVRFDPPVRSASQLSGWRRKYLRPAFGFLEAGSASNDSTAAIEILASDTSGAGLNVASAFVAAPADTSLITRARPRLMRSMKAWSLTSFCRAITSPRLYVHSTKTCAMRPSTRSPTVPNSTPEKRPIVRRNFTRILSLPATCSESSFLKPTLSIEISSVSSVAVHVLWRVARSPSEAIRLASPKPSPSPSDDSNTVIPLRFTS
eukprot:CAMPEP_0181390570 /NCGR_PEP_ID=MMETSP1106-20121128/25558_1 /TAXON_ID=81844 /ORGANISM="Mantoniella antarctica, Strain SL-175" /LENGTH=208 /DNA_ID=CAMNT_0023511495 /DNA_START=989 /DNA_END=1612 /DNA_ORIENTATION=+